MLTVVLMSSSYPTSRTMRFILALILGALMIARPEDIPRAYLPWPPLDLDAAPNFVTGWKVRAMAVDGGICRAALSASSAGAVLLPDKEVSEQCRIRHRVRLSTVSVAKLTPVETRCEIAARLYLWERNVLQPAAREHLRVGVARIHHFDSYACRAMRTSRGTSGRMSEHASANAIDIAGFTLADGNQISLLRHWDGDTPEAKFLRAARNGLCDWFNVTLSPDYNRLHADHFHVDMGPFLSCR